MKLYDPTFSEIISVFEEAAMTLSRHEPATAAMSSAALAALPAYAMPGRAAPTAKGDPMTTTLTPYLLFDGNCQTAMEFYRSCFGGELALTKVKDSPVKDHMPSFQQEKTLNARLRSVNLEISASDWLRPNEARVRGYTVCLYLSGGTFHELKTLFDKLAEGADITDPLKVQFFGAYGALKR